MLQNVTPFALVAANTICGLEFASARYLASDAAVSYKFTVSGRMRFKLQSSHSREDLLVAVQHLILQGADRGDLS